MRRFFALLSCVSLLAASVSFSALADAATMFEWDRNTEIDLEHYELYYCTSSSTCIPGLTAADRLGGDIPQTAVGVKPTMLFPPGKQGRAGVLAVDLVGNKSGLGNLVPFADATPPATPTGLVTK